MRPSSRAMRSRQACVASTGEIFRAAIARARVWIVQSVTRLYGLRITLECQHEARRLFAESQIGRHPLDGPGQTRDVRARTLVRNAHGPMCADDSTAVTPGDRMPRAAGSRSSCGRREDARTPGAWRGVPVASKDPS